jgi:hypothetical protein
VQNLSGTWIDVPPIPHTFVVNIGKGKSLSFFLSVIQLLLIIFPRSYQSYAALETVTRGLARATSHRVLAPPKGSTPRYSIPFFQNIAQDLRLSDAVVDFSPEVLKLKDARGEVGATDCTFFVASFYL